jgi:hypothetical protein
METCFDWEETAVQLAAFSGHSAVFTGDEVRLRWAAIAGADEGGGDDLGDIDDDLMLDELIAAAEEGVDGSSVPQLTTGNASVATFELVEGYFGSAATEGSVPDYDDESVHKLDSDDKEEGGAPEESAAIRELDAAENALATIEAERRVAREQLFQRVLTSLGGPSDSGKCWTASVGLRVNCGKIVGLQMLTCPSLQPFLVLVGIPFQRMPKFTYPSQ